MSDKIEEAFAELESLHAEYAEAQAQADYLDDFTKTLMSAFMAEVEAKGVKVATIQERDARRDQRFQDHLIAKKLAKMAALKLKGKITVKTMQFEYWRTRQANQRAAMNLR